MKFTLRNSQLRVLLLEKARLEWRCNPIIMAIQVYSFTGEKMVIIWNYRDLARLVEERRARGCSQKEPDLWRKWHLAQIQKREY